MLQKGLLLSFFSFFLIFFSVSDILKKGLIEHVVRKSKAESFETYDILHKQEFHQGRMHFLFVCFLLLLLLLLLLWWISLDAHFFHIKKKKLQTNPMSELA